MSIIYNDNNCAFISHEQFLNKLYKTVLYNGLNSNFQVKEEYFAIAEPFKVSRQKAESILDKKSHEIKSKFQVVKSVISKLLICQNQLSTEVARIAAENVNLLSNPVENSRGGNTSEENICVKIEGHQFLLPKYSLFYNYDVNHSFHYLNEKYDLILLDPPWWNKAVRRKRSWNKSECYQMMWNEDLARIPVKSLLAEDALVAVWCTNAKSHSEALTNDIFPQWGVSAVSSWTWLKITRKGEPVVPFAPENRKQPFEQIIFATANRNRKHGLPSADKLVISVPSAIHSHKPPLTDLLEPYLPDHPKCLEFFARYLLPNWHSYGNEVLKLQHIELFKEVKCST